MNTKKNKSKLYALRLLSFTLLMTLNIHSGYTQAFTVNGTTGTPLGGIGAGAIKFNANNGTFAIMTRPPADAYDFKTVRNAAFQLFTKNENSTKTINILKASCESGKTMDDAIWPLHNVDFGITNGIKISMNAFSPFDNKNYDNMSLPYAFYEITVFNQNRLSTEVAVALQWNAGDERFTTLPNRGISSANTAIVATAATGKETVTSGSETDNTFFTEGKCNNMTNSATAKVAIKTTLKPGETKKLRFVIAWYENTDPELAYYFNLYKNPTDIADHGIRFFSKLQNNATNLVTRFRAASLPEWLKNQTLNTLANLSTNTMYKKDGRFAFAEGQWTCFGTMDQMWHARQIVGQLLPYFAWQELRYWARTQMKNGQIHHDHNLMEEGAPKEKRSSLVGWDDTEHSDYRRVEKWVDLNAAMIISTYEIYQMTGDKKEMDYFWPYLKKAGQRMLDQVKLYGNKNYPYTFDTSENSYDAGGDPNPFNASISAVAYKIMMNLSNEKAEPDLLTNYETAYNNVVTSFEKRYLNNSGFKTVKHCESYYTGQWLAFHLKLGEIWSTANTDFVLEKLDSYYHPYYYGLGNPNGTYDEWTPYILTHYGGLLLNTKRQEQWAVMQKDAFERQYMNRNMVFNHPLNILPKVNIPKWTATNTSSDKQYISLPAIWRNYYDIVGIFSDKNTKELWVKPILINEMKGEFRNALFFTPEGFGTISCKASGTVGQNKEITVCFDNPVEVSNLYLEDNFGQDIQLSIDGKSTPFSRKGSGYAKELVVQLNRKIASNGINITVIGQAGTTLPPLPEHPDNLNKKDSVTLKTIAAGSVLEAENATKYAGIQIVKTDSLSYVTSCDNFDYIQFEKVDFGEKGMTSFIANVASTSNGSSIEILLDNVAGETIGNCVIDNTGSLSAWKKMSCTIMKTTGVHDVILRFSGNVSTNLMNLDNITFKSK